MEINKLNPHYSSYMLAEIQAGAEKLRKYPHHNINCYVHIEPEVCDCGQEEAEKEMADDETTDELGDDENSDVTESENSLQNDEDGDDS